MSMDVFISIGSFIVIFVIYLIVNSIKLFILKHNKNKKKISFTEVKYLNYKYGIDSEKITNLWFILLFGFINSFIISFTYFVVMLIPWAMVFQILVGFVLLVGLIYSIYGIIGGILSKKGSKK